MVQYILTPWRDRRELLRVREQFYGTGSTDQRQEEDFLVETTTLPSDTLITSGPFTSQDHVPAGRSDEHDRGVTAQQQLASPSSQTRTGKTCRQRQAVARVSMWMQRGNCPHMVESTALLSAAMLSDDGLTGGAYAVRAAYSAAFSRFVTGLLDGHQDKQRKQSMYSIAKTLGLPATFVELRHQATHEQLPSLAKLRSAASKALEWIWNYYWKHLADEPNEAKSDPCRDVVLGYLRGGEESQTLMLLKQFDKDKVLAVITDVQESLPGNQVYLRCLKLSKEVMMRQDQTAANETKSPEETIRDDETEPCSGWSLYQGPWKPKPIGIV